LESLEKSISLLTGRGLLDIRAWIASVVGPSRLPMGSKSSYLLEATKDGVMIATNIGVADAVVLVGVAAESGQDAAGVAGLLGTDGQMGTNSWPVQFLPYSNIYPQVALLLPGDQLFAKSVGGDVRIIVSQVTFK
jgi:hypothetical protein